MENRLVIFENCNYYDWIFFMNELWRNLFLKWVFGVSLKFDIYVLRRDRFMWWIGGFGIGGEMLCLIIWGGGVILWCWIWIILGGVGIWIGMGIGIGILIILWIFFCGVWMGICFGIVCMWVSCLMGWIFCLMGWLCLLCIMGFMLWLIVRGVGLVGIIGCMLWLMIGWCWIGCLVGWGGEG